MDNLGRAEPLEYPAFLWVCTRWGIWDVWGTDISSRYNLYRNEHSVYKLLQWCLNGDAQDFLQQRFEELTLTQGVYLHTIAQCLHWSTWQSHTRWVWSCSHLSRRRKLWDDDYDHPHWERPISCIWVFRRRNRFSSHKIYALSCPGLEPWSLFSFSHRENNFRGAISIDIKRGVAPAVAPGNLSPTNRKYWSLIEGSWNQDQTLRPEARIF